jgi:cytochrome b
MGSKPYLAERAPSRARRRPFAQRVAANDNTIRVQVWDLPVRIFHWSLVAAVSTAIISGEIGGDLMPLHGKAGLAIVGLVTFRLVWGVVGTTHARFLSFLPTPSRVMAHLRGRWQGHGHNPLGALSVLALLGLLALQAGTGLFANDEIAFTGPLSPLVNEALALRLTGWHQLLANLLLGLIALHVVAIFFYQRIKKHKLIEPMVTGWKDVASPKGVPPQTAEPSAQQAGSERPVTVRSKAGSWPALVFALAVSIGAVAAVSAGHTDQPAPVATPVSQSAPAW